MKKGKIIYKGHFGDYFVKSIGLLVLSVFTLGLLLPYYFYYQFRYFFSSLEIEIYE